MKYEIQYGELKKHRETCGGKTRKGIKNGKKRYMEIFS